MANANDKVREFVAQLPAHPNVCVIVNVDNATMAARVKAAKAKTNRQGSKMKSNGTWRVKGKTFGSIK